MDVCEETSLISLVGHFCLHCFRHQNPRLRNSYFRIPAIFLNSDHDFSRDVRISAYRKLVPPIADQLDLAVNRGDGKIEFCGDFRNGAAFEESGGDEFSDRVIQRFQKFGVDALQKFPGRAVRIGKCRKARLCLRIALRQVRFRNQPAATTFLSIKVPALIEGSVLHPRMQHPPNLVTTAEGW